LKHGDETSSSKKTNNAANGGSGKGNPNDSDPGETWGGDDTQSIPGGEPDRQERVSTVGENTRKKSHGWKAIVYKYRSGLVIRIVLKFLAGS